MSTNQVQKGDTIQFTAAGALASGAVVPLQHCVGIAMAAAAGAGALIPLALEGVFTVPKAAGTAWVVGEKLVWDASANAFATTAVVLAAGDLTGVAIVAAPAASGDVVGVAKLTPGNAARQ